MSMNFHARGMMDYCQSSMSTNLLVLMNLAPRTFRTAGPSPATLWLRVLLPFSTLEHLVLLKSTTISSDVNWREAGRLGLVDPLFGDVLQHAR